MLNDAWIWSPVDRGSGRPITAWSGRAISIHAVAKTNAAPTSPAQIHERRSRAIAFSWVRHGIAIAIVATTTTKNAGEIGRAIVNTHAAMTVRHTARRSTGPGRSMSTSDGHRHAAAAISSALGLIAAMIEIVTGVRITASPTIARPAAESSDGDNRR